MGIRLHTLPYLQDELDSIPLTDGRGTAASAPQLETAPASAPVGTHLLSPDPGYPTDNHVGAEGLQSRALPAMPGPQTTSTASTAGLLRDLRIRFQTGIFKAHNVFPTSSGSGIIAKETGATNSAFLFPYWMKHELKMGRKQRNPAWKNERTAITTWTKRDPAGEAHGVSKGCKAASLPFRGPLLQSLQPPRCWASQHPAPPPGKAQQPWGRIEKRGRNSNSQLREQPPPSARSIPPHRRGMPELALVAMHSQPCQLLHRIPLPARLGEPTVGLRTGSFSWCCHLSAGLFHFEACLYRDQTFAETAAGR